MLTLNLKLKEHFSRFYSDKEYLRFELVPKPYSKNDFKISWYVPHFIDDNYIYKKILHTFQNESDNSKTIPITISKSLLPIPIYLNKERYSSTVNLKINASNLDQLVFDQFIDKFFDLIFEYEKIYALKKPFSKFENNS